MPGLVADSVKGRRNMTGSDKQGLLLLAALTTIAFLAFLSPMRSVLIWAAALAIIFGPRNEKLAVLFDGRNLAAALTVLLAIVTVMLPVCLIAYFSREQFATMVANMSSFTDNLPANLENVERILSQSLGVDINLGIGNQQETATRLKQLEQGLNDQVLRFGGAAVTEIVEVTSTLYILFFFLRDWRSILSFITNLVPLKMEHKSELVIGMVSVVNATLRGTIIVSALQAGVAGLFYFALGIDTWALLAAVTFIVCMMPAIGSGVVWIPVSLYFLFTGQVAHFWIMFLGGLLVIGMIDNFLRPSLIGKETALPEFLIFLMSFGGLFLIGIDGLLLGPIVAKLFITLWTMYAAEGSATTEETAEKISG